MSLPKSARSARGAVAVIVGSAFSERPPSGLELEVVHVETPWGEVALHRVTNAREDRPAYLLFRHGLPHATYPQELNFRAHAVALRQVNCEALLVTSSVGVLDEDVPLDTLMFVDDLLMPDSRLPCGALCTVLMTPPRLSADPALSEAHKANEANEANEANGTNETYEALKPGHLVLRGPLNSAALERQVERFILDAGQSLAPAVTFAYVAGPRTKTRAENRYWARLGAQVNSMSVGPEITLANELLIPTATLVIGHKRSSPEPHPRGVAIAQLDDQARAARREMSSTFERSHRALESVIRAFLGAAEPVSSTHYIYRYAETLIED